MEQYIVEGNISVKAALLANKRPIEKIIVDEKKRDKDTSYILRKAKELGVLIESVDRTIIDSLAQGKTHGGLLAVCGEREFQSLNDVIKKEDVFLALVEGIEDPFNFGYVLRSLYAAGCDGVIIPPRNWTSAASVVTKSSAGASEY
ncbi:MAG: RNA methyltransferase substrate-binding domain-containing protein [Longicatena sp.]